jgi:thiamine pyrophosphate-dependent acetolactate synthase large subunit-like protein
MVSPVSEIATRTGGEWVVAALEAEGVRHVFGIPGVHNLGIYDALLRQDRITHILARHEQGAGFMADGYARASGRPGVIVVTTGPGATNALTPLVEAHASSQPVLLVMSDVPSALVGQDMGALHEVSNQIECFRPVSRWADGLRSGTEIPGAVQGAFHLFRTGRPGPEALSIPTDLLNAPVSARLTPAGEGRRPPCDVGLVEEAARYLARARRPLLVAGGGVIAAGATAELEALARRLGAPVITSVMGRGAISEADPLWLGVLPNQRATKEALEAADVILAVGCRFAHRSTRGLLLNLELRPDQALLQIDLDPRTIGRMHVPALGLVGDARDGLAGVLACLPTTAPAPAWDWTALGRARAARSPRYTTVIDGLLRALRETVPADGIVVADQSGLNYWMEWHLPVLRPRTFLYPIGSATLGYGVPASIGAKIACPDRAVVAVVGDGGLLFTAQELATAAKYRLPIVFVVMNDQDYGAIRYLQARLYGRTGEHALGGPDILALARAFGVEAYHAADPDALRSALDKALAQSGPVVVEVPLAVEPPWEL